MNVTVCINVSKEDVEVLSQALESNLDENMESFISKVLKATQETTDSMIETAEAVRSVNPFSMV